MTPLDPTQSDRRFAILLGGLLFVSFPLVALGLQSFFVRDFAVFGYPLACFHKSEFWSGRLPLWNPLNFCGVPHLAQWNSLLLYPGSLIYLLLPLPWSLNLFCVLHQFLGGLGMARLTRELTPDRQAGVLAGVAFAFGGLSLNALMWPNNIAALGLLPWVILSVLRAVQHGGRVLPIAVLVGAAQMLTGAPEIILVTWIFTVAWLLAVPRREQPTRAVGRLVVVIGLISLVAAAQLLPFFKLLQFANRTAGDVTTGWSASPSCWVNFLLPGYQGVPTEHGYPLNHFQKWTLSFYPGMLTLLGAAFAFTRRDRHALILGGLALAGLALASGHYSTAYKWLSEFLPLDLMRFPVKFVLFPVIALPLLAAIGWSRLRSDPPSRTRLGVIGSLFLIAFALAVFLDQTSNAARPERPDKWDETAWRGGFMIAAFALLVFRQRIALTLPWLAALLLWADLRWHMPSMTESVSASAYRVKMEPQARPPERLHVTRAAWSGLYALELPDPRKQLREHLNGRTGLLNLLRKEAVVGGFLSLTPPSAREVREVIDGDDWRTVNGAMADFVGVGELGHWREGVKWDDRPNPATLVTSGQSPVFDSTDGQLERMRRPGFDPLIQVCFDEAAAAHAVTNPVEAEIELTRFAAHEVRFRARASGPTTAVIAQSWYPAWKAYVNEVTVPVLRANLQFQALPLPAGDSNVVLRYEDRAFRLGLILSLFGLGITVALWWRASPRSPHDDSPGVGESQRLVGGE